MVRKDVDGGYSGLASTGGGNSVLLIETGFQELLQAWLSGRNSVGRQFVQEAGS